MADRWVVVLAASVAAGARLSGAIPVPLLLVVALVGFTVLARRPIPLCLAAAALASMLGARAWDGLDPVPAQPVHTWVTLVSDPTPRFGAVHADARLGDRRVELTARGRSAAVLRERLAGERVEVTGVAQPLTAQARRRAAPRHVVGRVAVSRIGGSTEAGGVAGFANDVRRTLVRGSTTLDQTHQSLFTGFVIGDDRGQDDDTRTRFRDAGLSHLLAVSGQNVAFALAVVAPALRRFGLRGRLAGNLAVLVVFGVLTRWEPSVLRAEAMAALSLVAFTVARPVSALRVLALAVTALVLVDPLLVWSVGFGLSVGASVGIALLAPRIAGRVPGPRPVAAALAVTVAAQIGVLPILVPVFGGVPLAALPANLLAAPAAGPVMAWGLSAGMVAGVVGGDLAEVLHLPTRLLVGWIDGVAAWAASLPLPTLPSRP